jgi:membrane protease YdiL (CAAX protease family)
MVGPQSRWLGRHPVLVAFVALVVSLVPSVVFFARTGGESDGSVLEDLWPGLVIAAVSIAALVWATGWARQVGLVAPNHGWWRWYLLPSLWAVGMLLVGRFTEWSEPDEFPFLALVLVLLLVGIVEELVYRGFLLHIFRRRLSVGMAVGAVSALFSFTHLGGGGSVGSLLATVAAVFSLAVLQAALYLLGGSIVPVIAFHVWWDVMMFSGGAVDLGSGTGPFAWVGLVTTTVMSLGYAIFLLQRFTQTPAGSPNLIEDSKGRS